MIRQWTRRFSCGSIRPSYRNRTIVPDHARAGPLWSGSELSERSQNRGCDPDASRFVASAHDRTARFRKHALESLAAPGIAGLEWFVESHIGCAPVGGN